MIDIIIIDIVSAAAWLCVVLYCVCVCVYVAVIYICNDNVFRYGNIDIVS
jgi:hypothetical protein